MKLIKVLALLAGFLTAMSIFAQRPIYQYDPSLVYKEAIDLFDHEKYVPAKEKFEQFIDREKDTQNALRINAEYYAGMCALYLNHKDAEFLIEKFVHEHPDSPWIQRAYFELATVNFQKRSFKKSIEWFNKVDQRELTVAERMEFFYKRGYAYWETDNKAAARTDFFEATQNDGEYKQAALYYYSHITYEQGDLQTALDGFQKLSNDPSFAPLVPYYITQIYYKQKRYDELLAYAPKVLESAQANATKRVPEIARLIGDAHFIKGNYAQAIPYLEQFQNTAEKSSITREDNYQLGYAYYRNGDYQKAIDEFGGCSGEKDELYQLATYNLGDCYLKLEKKEYARNAFGEAADLDFNREVQEDAMFNYSKLAFELSYNPFHEAITAFENYLEKYPDSPRRDEAYEFLLNVYMKTRNYEKALASLDKIKNKDNRVKEAYQVVAYNRGVELFQSEKYADAEKFFDKVSTYPVNPIMNSDAKFWKAEISFRQRDYKKAVQRYNSFLNEEGSIKSEFYGLANYGIGYAYFKQANDEENIEQMRELYSNANTAFRKFADGVGEKDKRKVNDANLRIGDCFYVTKSYAQAVQYYDRVADLDEGNRDYAMYQKAMCYGFDGLSDKKSWVLKNLLTDIPDSKFEVDAKYELAKTYLQQNRLAEAKNYYNDVLKNHATSAYAKRAMADMCLVHVKENNAAAAKEMWNTLYQKYPNDPILADAVAAVRSTLIEDPEFQQQIRNIKYVNISNEDIESEVYAKASDAAVNGDCAKGIEKLTAYLKQYQPAYFGVEANYLLGNCFFDNNEMDKALECFNYVITQPLSDYTEESLKLAATIQFNKKNYQQALQHYTDLEQVAVIKNNILEAQIGCMRCNYFLGQLNFAKEYADKVIANTNTPEEIRTGAYLWRGNIKLENEDYGAANADYKEVIKRGGVSAAEAKYKLALILYKQADYKKAEAEVFQLLERYAAFDEWKFKGYLLLSDVYVGMKDYFQARTTLNAIIERVTVEWVVAEAKVKLAELDALENPAGDGTSTPDEINLQPEGNN